MSGTGPARPAPRAVAEAVTDPELPMLTLADLGVLREVSLAGDMVIVSITPTYAGCPAADAIRADLISALRRAGYASVQVRAVLSPPWSSDWITAAGRRKLAAAGLAPPGPAPRRPPGPVPLSLGASPPGPACPSRPGCPRCGSEQTVQISYFGATACTSVHRCEACREPFEHVKEI